jgi:hypothetical protein
MLQVDILGRRRPDPTHDQVAGYWRDVHAPLVESQSLVNRLNEGGSVNSDI